MSEQNDSKTTPDGTRTSPCSGSLPVVSFEIARVNLLRMRRGAEAVEMAIFEDGEQVDQLWMSKRDVVRNIRQWGTCEAFQAALEIYRTGRDVRETND